jgi:peptidoglycan/LPS O-acetylase OafA/YrhL
VDLSSVANDVWCGGRVEQRTSDRHRLKSIETTSLLLSSRTRSESFHLLDGLRGVAAVAVLMVHAAVLFRPVWMRSGYLAVDLFFALSGFVLAHAYGPRLTAGMTALAFLRLRLIRILPLYLLGTTIAVASALEQHAIGHGEWQTEALVRSIVAAAFLVPLPPVVGAPNGFAFPLNIPAWSLFFELLVNVFYATAFRFLTPFRTVVLVGIALAGLIGTTWYFNGLNAGADWPKLWGGVHEWCFRFSLAWCSTAWWEPCVGLPGGLPGGLAGWDLGSSCRPCSCYSPCQCRQRSVGPSISPAWWRCFRC